MDVREQADLLAQRAGVRILDDVVVSVVGEDAREWLHGQLTIDLRQPTEHVRYGLVLAVKGRIVGDLHVIERGDTEDGERFDLLLPASHAPAILERLERFLVMEDVELETLPLRVISVQGPESAAVLAGLPGAMAIDRLARGGHELLVPAAEAEAIAAGLDAPRVSEAAWELARLRGGRARMGLDFGDDTLPQEAGLEKRALSFDQGCYVGQEPVVMLQHRGKPPKRLVRLVLDAGPAPRIGDTVFAGERPAGKVTSAAADGPGALALALVKRKLIEDTDTLTVGNRPAQFTIV